MSFSFKWNQFKCLLGFFHIPHLSCLYSGFQLVWTCVPCWRGIPQLPDHLQLLIRKKMPFEALFSGHTYLLALLQRAQMEDLAPHRKSFRKIHFPSGKELCVLLPEGTWLPASIWWVKQGRDASEGIKEWSNRFLQYWHLKENESSASCTSEVSALPTGLGRGGQHGWGVCCTIMYQG